LFKFQKRKQEKKQKKKKKTEKKHYLSRPNTNVTQAERSKKRAESRSPQSGDSYSALDASRGKRRLKLFTSWAGPYSFYISGDQRKGGISVSVSTVLVKSPIVFLSDFKKL
jgi:hypothetical protein